MLKKWRTKSRTITHSLVLGVWLLFHDYGNGAIYYLWNRNYVKWAFRYTFYSNFLRLLMTWKTIMFFKLEFVSFQRDASTCFFPSFVFIAISHSFSNFLSNVRFTVHVHDLNAFWVGNSSVEQGKSTCYENGRNKLLRVTAIFTL